MRIELELPLWTRQFKSFISDATEVFFGGSTEGGKSHMIRVALIAWCLAIPGLQCVLIRKKIDDIIQNHCKGRTGFETLLEPLIKVKGAKVTQDGVSFYNGSMIAFVHCQDERQFNSAQGVEKHVLVIDEATQISERLIRFFRGWVRMPKEMKETLPEEYKGRFPRILYTANPIGVSVGFFRRNFVKCRPPFAIEMVEGFKRQYIPSKATDNGSVDLEAHEGRLSGVGDQALIRALGGDWDAPMGDFFPEWDETRHVISTSKGQDILLPEHWFRYRSFDWGSSEPFAVVWAAVSDGEEFGYDGEKYWFPRGAIIIYREWYGCFEGDPANGVDPEPSKGIRMRNDKIAQGIRERTHETNCKITLTDSLPFQDRGGPTIADDFRDEGVILSKADTGRIGGWKKVRDRLIGKDGDPMIYIMASCKYVRDYIPALSRHPTKLEDAVESGEATHICDTVRYIVTAFVPIEDAPVDPNKENDVNLSLPTFEQALKSHHQRRNHDPY